LEVHPGLERADVRPASLVEGYYLAVQHDLPVGEQAPDLVG